MWSAAQEDASSPQASYWQAECLSSLSFESFFEINYVFQRIESECVVSRKKLKTNN